MPVIFTFDLAGAPPIERNRLQCAFERLGWQNLGGSAYRYPKLGTADQPVEDWFNHIVPALMLFRAYIRQSGRAVSKFSIDVQSSGGYNPATEFGSAPIAGGDVRLYAPANTSFGERNLRDWLDGVAFPYQRADQ